MWPTLFRPCRWNRPNRTCEIELDPFGGPELSGAGEKKRHQLQCDPSHSLTVEGINCTKESAQCLRICDSGSGRGFDLDKRASQSICRVGVRAGSSVAIAYRNTLPIVDRSRRADSYRPRISTARSTFRTAGASTDLIGMSPRSASVNASSHSVLAIVVSARPSRFSFVTYSSAIARNVTASVCSCFRRFFSKVGSVPPSGGALHLLEPAAPAPMRLSGRPRAPAASVCRQIYKLAATGDRRWVGPRVVGRRHPSASGAWLLAVPPGTPHPSMPSLCLLSERIPTGWADTNKGTNRTRALPRARRSIRLCAWVRLLPRKSSNA